MTFIIIVDYSRKDILAFFDKVSKEHQIYFLYYNSENNEQIKYHSKFGNSIFWNNFKDSYSLIEKIRPNKVLFFSLETFNQIALNIACKSKGIKTTHIDHGVLYPSLEKLILHERYQQNKSLKNILRKNIIVTYFSLLKNSFYLWTLLKSNKKDIKLLFKFYKVRSNNNLYDTFEKIKDKRLVPSNYIFFNEINHSFYEQIHHYIIPILNYEIIGFPCFDKLKFSYPAPLDSKLILYIDQPFAEYNHFGWTTEYLFKIMDQINTKILEPQKKKLLVKCHPISNISNWNKIHKKYKNIELINDQEMISYLPSISSVIGYASSLLLPFTAQKNIVCFCMEIHPKINFNYAHDFLVDKIVEKVINIDELALKMQNHTHYLEIQLKHKTSFCKKWLYQLDGKSQQRLDNILIS